MNTTTTTEGPKRTGTTMKAVVQDAYGSVDQLSVKEIPRPPMADGQVLVRVHAASVNHADSVYLTGRPLISRLAFGLRRPKLRVRGQDIAGTVELVGKSVAGFRIGDAVYAEVASGGFAQYAVVAEDRLALKPANLSFELAATVPLAARTALQGLREGGRVRPGHRVLINGASGGVGSFAVQIAKELGAEVTGVCSTRNAAFVRSLGADHIVDYTREDFTKRVGRFDVILDLVGNHSIGATRRALTPRGTLVLSSGTGGRIVGPMGRIARALALSPFIRQNLRIFTPALGTRSLDQLRELIESGRVIPAIDSTFALTEAAAAIRHFIEDHVNGKIVIGVNSSSSPR